jgi:hypothetical protein
MCDVCVRLRVVQILLGCGLLFGAWLLSDERRRSSFALSASNLPSSARLDLCAPGNAGLDGGAPMPDVASMDLGGLPPLMTCDTAAVAVSLGFLRCLGFNSTGEFDEWLRENSPPDYLNDNPSYRGCQCVATRANPVIEVV